MHNNQQIIGIDIGGTSIRIGAANQTGQLSAFEKVPQDTILYDDTPNGLINFITDYIARHKATFKAAGIVLAFPATLNKERTMVMSAPNIKGVNEKPIKAILEDALSLPIYLQKDVNTLLYYDLMRFGLEKEEVVIGCYVGTGLGSAAYVNGKILTGCNGAAGELGHIPVWGCTEPCGCGNIGCAEGIVAGKYLAKLCRENFPNTPIGQLFIEQAQHPLLQEYIKVLAAVITTEINILDPQVVVLGGGVISMENFPKHELEKNIRMMARKPFPAECLRFIYSDNDGENGVIGSVIFGWKELLK